MTKKGKRTDAPQADTQAQEVRRAEREASLLSLRAALDETLAAYSEMTLEQATNEIPLWSNMKWFGKRAMALHLPPQQSSGTGWRYAQQKDPSCWRTYTGRRRARGGPH